MSNETAAARLAYALKHQAYGTWEDYVRVVNQALAEERRRVSERECVWTMIDDGDDQHYETTCNEAYYLIDGTLDENRHRYCPYCGGKIRQAQTRAEGEHGPR